MDGWNISCRSCDRTWNLGSTFSEYEQQAIESRPCPHCAAYTLSCSSIDDHELVAAEAEAARRWPIAC